MADCACSFYAALRSSLPIEGLDAARDAVRRAPHDSAVEKPIYFFLLRLALVPDAIPNDLHVPRKQQILELLGRLADLIPTNPQLLEACAQILVLTLSPNDVHAAEAAIWAATDDLLAAAFPNINNIIPSHNTAPNNASSYTTSPLKTPSKPLRQPTLEDTLNDTPAHAHTGLLSPSNNKHEDIDPYLRSELKGAVLKNVQNFHTFFPGITKQQWTCAVSCPASCTCSYQGHPDGSSNLPPGVAAILNTFPVNISESSVLGWFTNLNQFLGNRCFYGSGTRALADSSSDRKCDLFLSPLTTTTKHSWRSVLVPAELKCRKAEDCIPKTILQIAGYAREVFGAQVNRRFVHGFTICGSYFRCYLFDRAGVSISECFNISKNARTRRLFARILLEYATMTPVQLGFDINYTTGTDGTPFVPTPDVPLPEYYSFRGRRYKLLENIFHRSVIVSRGTLCWRAREENALDHDITESAEEGRVQHHNQDCVIKDSWRTTWRMAEGDLLSRATSRGVWGIPTVTVHGPVSSPGNNLTGSSAGDGNVNDGTNFLRAQLSFANATPVAMTEKNSDGQYLLSTTIASSIPPPSHSGSANLVASSDRDSKASNTSGSGKRRSDNEHNQLNQRKMARLESGSKRQNPSPATSSTSPTNVAASTPSAPSIPTSRNINTRSCGPFPSLPPPPPLAPAEPTTRYLYESGVPPPQHLFTDLTHSIIISHPVGKCIHKFSTNYELLCAFYDAIRCHKSLVEAGGIIHRDISPNNIIISTSACSLPFNPDLTTEPPRGFLIDLDLAKELPPLAPPDLSSSAPNPSIPKRRTGTMMFMAIQVLECTPQHSYRHDLESFFYVLIYLCISCAPDSIPLYRAELSKAWACGEAASKKSQGMSDMETWEKLVGWLAPSMRGLSGLLEGWRTVLFPTTRQGGGVEKGTEALGERKEVYERILRLIKVAIEEEGKRVV